ncbi:Uncharacterised protein [Salmonella enterica subsp. enterica serovar Bovismorbificans]|uniref:Uncharacterized protein n=1 Tax=Salmonella enterica subsp. enterica serovar Bovismorbificans TaxID=58097 RepID=A0A655CJE2_SALET|nr:Uncharacterised protein [Salmonella enterica subsp. enterica serovar Bovismorbificans]CPR62162.1 Uncharacterised protein [Salmonella enterica subsp. enterica serovar Bovismorbificans]
MRNIDDDFPVFQNPIHDRHRIQIELGSANV